MTAATLAFMTVMFALAASRSSYHVLWFLSGICAWGLGVWWVYNPLAVGSSPINDIALTICFLGGVVLMVMMNWRTNGKGVGGFNFRIPRMFGGQSEEDEAMASKQRKWRDMREMYRERMDKAIRGRRGR